MRARLTGLWRHPDFLKLWGGESVAFFGIYVANLAVPLTAAYPDVALDLQAALARTHERFYGDRLAYRGEPPPPRLQPADSAWLAARLKANR